MQISVSRRETPNQVRAGSAEKLSIVFPSLDADVNLTPQGYRYPRDLCFDGVRTTQASKPTGVP